MTEAAIVSDAAELRVPDTKMIACDPKMIPDIWPRVRDMIDAGYAASDDLMPDDLEKLLRKRLRVLWLVVADEERIIAAVTTAILKKRSGLCLQIVAGSGFGMKAWLPLHKQFEDYARAEGCVKLLVTGRRGWLRALDGFTERETTMEKQVSP